MVVFRVRLGNARYAPFGKYQVFSLGHPEARLQTQWKLPVRRFSQTSSGPHAPGKQVCSMTGDSQLTPKIISKKKCESEKKGHMYGETAVTKKKKKRFSCENYALGYNRHGYDAW